MSFFQTFSFLVSSRYYRRMISQREWSSINENKNKLFHFIKYSVFISLPICPLILRSNAQDSQILVSCFIIFVSEMQIHAAICIPGRCKFSLPPSKFPIWKGPLGFLVERFSSSCLPNFSHWDCHPLPYSNWNTEIWSRHCFLPQFPYHASPCISQVYLVLHIPNSLTQAFSISYEFLQLSLLVDLPHKWFLKHSLNNTSETHHQID